MSSYNRWSEAAEKLVEKLIFSFSLAIFFKKIIWPSFLFFNFQELYNLLAVIFLWSDVLLFSVPTRIFKNVVIVVDLESSGWLSLVVVFLVHSQIRQPGQDENSLTEWGYKKG